MKLEEALKEFMKANPELWTGEGEKAFKAGWSSAMVSASPYNWKSTGPGGCDNHCIEHPCGPCITGKWSPE